MQAVITHPGGVRQGVASEEARRGLELESGQIETVVRPSATLTGAERLAIYSRSYQARLLSCFRSMFPGLCHALGEELLGRFAMDYLVRHPPTSFTLGDLARDFPRHLEETRPDRDAPPSARELWPDFIIELAALELAIFEVSEGPGLEGRPTVSAGEVFALPGKRLLRARLERAPCLRLFTCRWPVRAYLMAVRAGASKVLPEPATTFVALCRCSYRVFLHELGEREHALLSALAGPLTVGEALELSGGGESAATVKDWLCVGASRGFFSALSHPRPR